MLRGAACCACIVLRAVTVERKRTNLNFVSAAGPQQALRRTRVPSQLSHLFSGLCVCVFVVLACVCVVCVVVEQVVLCICAAVHRQLSLLGLLCARVHT